MKKRIYFQPTSQILNAGDQLINLATLNAVRSYGEIFIDDLQTPKWFVESISDKSDRRFSELAKKRFHISLTGFLIKQLGSRDKIRHVLICSPGHSSRKGFQEAKKALSWYSKLLVMRMLGCTVIRAGFSIGPFDRLNGWVESFGTRCFSFYGLRDHESLAIAKNFHFSNAHYFPDLAWSFTPVQRQAPAPESGPVIVSFRSNAYGLIHSTAYLSPICERVGRMLASPALAGKRVLVVYQVQTDDEASRELFVHLREVGIDVELIDRKLSIDEASALYATACCAISNRLHVLLLTAQSGSLPIPLADMKDNAKITSILKDNNLSDLIVDLQETEQEGLTRIQRLIRERADFLQRLDDARLANTQLIHSGFASAFASS